MFCLFITTLLSINLVVTSAAPPVIFTSDTLVIVIHPEPLRVASPLFSASRSDRSTQPERRLDGSADPFVAAASPPLHAVSNFPFYLVIATSLASFFVNVSSVLPFVPVTPTPRLVAVTPTPRLIATHPSPSGSNKHVFIRARSGRLLYSAAPSPFHDISDHNGPWRSQIYSHHVSINRRSSSTGVSTPPLQDTICRPDTCGLGS
ncbi:unnamed protein product [Eruca vesicaria subsp. sativa]|uniref:Secreted protein n=1 Tax=Eruca vesicaria subsp. sativa TaxID=29727 RepID=A0ABC8LJF0_ERUVS|nr:unnamed protein product [Eruca vesicaria subsp. sativa]